jgi:hypothetical protein
VCVCVCVCVCVFVSVSARAHAHACTRAPARVHASSQKQFLCLCQCNSFPCNFFFKNNFCDCVNAIFFPLLHVRGSRHHVFFSIFWLIFLFNYLYVGQLEDVAAVDFFLTFFLMDFFHFLFTLKKKCVYHACRAA